MASIVHEFHCPCLAEAVTMLRKVTLNLRQQGSAVHGEFSTDQSDENRDIYLADLGVQEAEDFLKRFE